MVNVRQDYATQMIAIERLNKAAEKLTGYASSEVAGRDFKTILPQKIKEAIDSYVDFEDPNSDFAAIARKISNFQILNKNGKEVPASLKVFHLISSDTSKPQYELLMRDITMIKRMEELKAQLTRGKEDDITDTATGLSSDSALKEALSTAYSFVEKDPVEVSFAVVAIDNLGDCLDVYGENVAMRMVKSLGTVAKKTCRTDDIVAHLGEGDIGLMLLDCNTENAKAVLERLNKRATEKPMALANGGEIPIKLSISYIQLDAEYELENIYDAARENLLNIQEDGGNAIVEV